MTAVQLNAMNTELWQSIGAIADSESLMRRLTRYAKKLLKERQADPTLMTKEEFFDKIDRAEKQPGKTFASVPYCSSALSVKYMLSAGTSA